MGHYSSFNQTYQSEHNFNVQWQQCTVLTKSRVLPRHNFINFQLLLKYFYPQILFKGHSINWSTIHGRSLQKAKEWRQWSYYIKYVLRRNELLIIWVTRFQVNVSVNETATKALFEKNKNCLRDKTTIIIIRMYLTSSLGKICNIQHEFHEQNIVDIFINCDAGSLSTNLI